MFADAPTRRRPHGFTLVEVVLTVFIVGVGLVASLQVLPVLIRTSEAASERLVAQGLATELLAEIAMLPFEDPDGSVKFGPEDNEDPTTRADFDDIDDYVFWQASPPQKKDGSPEPDASGYTRAVMVNSVEHDDFNQYSAPDTNKPKRIAVIVTRPDGTPIVITTVRLKGSNREDLE